MATVLGSEHSVTDRWIIRNKAQPPAWPSAFSPGPGARDIQPTSYMELFGVYQKEIGSKQVGEGGPAEKNK